MRVALAAFPGDPSTKCSRFASIKGSVREGGPTLSSLTSNAELHRNPREYKIPESCYKRAATAMAAGDP
jgi:hypothetical protein